MEELALISAATRDAARMEALNVAHRYLSGRGVADQRAAAAVRGILPSGLSRDAPQR